MKITVLGCGGSGGVPILGRTPGGHWGNCNPANPKNRRRRVSVLVEQGTSTLLVDTSPDLRLQLMDARVTGLDAVLYSHAHGDHCHGIDDLRSMVYARGAPIPAFMDDHTRARLTRRFDYAFTSSVEPGSFYKPLLEDRIIEGDFKVGDIEVAAFEQGHGSETTLGFRFGPAAYSTDVVELDEAAISALAGVRLWIVDCLRLEPHATHAHLEKTLAWIAEVKPERAVLTHMNHTLDYDALAELCPAGVEPGYDGLVVDLD